MHRGFFIFFHGVTIHLITMSKTFHSSNQYALVVLVKRWLRNTENVHFESLTIVFDDVKMFYHDIPAVLVQSLTQAYRLSELF